MRKLAEIQSVSRRAQRSSRGTGSADVITRARNAGGIRRRSELKRDEQSLGRLRIVLKNIALMKIVAIQIEDSNRGKWTETEESANENRRYLLLCDLKNFLKCYKIDAFDVFRFPLLKLKYPMHCFGEKSHIDISFDISIRASCVHFRGPSKIFEGFYFQT